MQRCSVRLAPAGAYSKHWLTCCCEPFARCGYAAYGLPNVYQSATVWEQYLVSVYWCAMRLCHGTRAVLEPQLSSPSASPTHCN